VGGSDDNFNIVECSSSSHKPEARSEQFHSSRYRGFSADPGIQKSIKMKPHHPRRRGKFSASSLNLKKVDIILLIEKICSTKTPTLSRFLTSRDYCFNRKNLFNKNTYPLLSRFIRKRAEQKLVKLELDLGNLIIASPRK
jgi:hypothetical protein